jgi:PelA/Pel-15E family pectate lyase
LRDGINHYRNRNGSDYATYPPERIVEIADNVLLYQRANGGWIENQDPTRVLGAGERAAVAADRTQPRISFDNRNVFSQVEYLAAVFAQTRDPRHRDASLRGLDAIFEHQLPDCGGWPHTVPAREPYHGHITIADDVTTGVLGVLRRMAAGAPPFAFAAPELRARAHAAVERGDACLLRLQVMQQGAPAGWAGQYDARTLQPAQGRSYELPAIVAQETTEVVRYLMSIEAPPGEVIGAVQTAIAWLERSRLTGVRLETFAAEPVKYKYHSSTTDRRLVLDPAAPPLWARFYDLGDNSVVLANRDGKRVGAYAEIARERRTGYAWYGDWPARLLDDEYPAWRSRTPGAALPSAALLAAIAAPAGGSVGFAAVDLATGRALGLRAEQPFPTQSVFKLPIAVEVLLRVDAGKLRLDRAVELTRADARAGAATVTVPGRRTVGELLEAMVVSSDNVACDKLLALLGGPRAVDARMRALGVQGMTIRFSEREMGAGNGDNSATPAAVAALLGKIARGEVGLSPAGARLLEDLLLGVTTGPRRLGGALPPGTPVAHKTGTSRTVGGKTDATNDAGLITLPGGGRIAVAVFVHASPADEATREAVIARLARAAYDAFAITARTAGSHEIVPAKE